MKEYRVLMAALCAAFLLCGMAAPAHAYSDEPTGGYTGDDPTPTEEDVTLEPGEGFSEEGGLVTRDLLYDKHTNKQFITVQTKGGSTFYIVIDYDKPVDEEGEQYETYFLNVVDEADLLAALAVVVIGGGAGWYFKIYRPKQEQAAAQAEEDYGDEPDPYDDPEEGYDSYGEDGYDDEETEGQD